MRRLLPEWSRQSGVLLAWPDPATDWKDLLQEVEPVYLALIEAIAERETVLVLVRNDEARAHLGRKLHGRVRASVHTVTQPVDDTWTRDYGPLSVDSDAGVVLCDYRFDGWGGRYPAERDDAVTRHLHAAGVFGNVRLQRHERVLEGGAIDANGAGLVLCNAVTFEARDPTGDHNSWEAWLKASLGVNGALWVETAGLDGDDTDGHIDTLARFCAKDRIAYQSCTDPDDAHFERLQALATRLGTFRTPDDRPFELLPLPWPGPVVHAGRRLPASYTNFLVINGAVLVPQFDDPADAGALSVLGRAFPGRAVVGLPATPLLTQSGGLHCATLQVPAAVALHGQPLQ